MSTPVQFAPSISVDTVIEAVGSFLQPFVGTAQVVRAEVNRVAPPSGPFVELTEVMLADLEYPSVWYSDANSQTNIYGPKRIAVQADFYGPLSGDWCAAVKQAFRSVYGPSQFATGIAPLYTDEGSQSPLVTGEEQYVRRWTLTMTLQYNPLVSIDAQSADELSMTLIKDVTP